jgi:hypothetical protein
VFATISAARTAYRCDRNGRTATCVSAPSERALKRTMPPLSAGRTMPARVMPATPISVR